VSDIHQLPLLGHDLPEVVFPDTPKARVFKEGPYWTWEHRCLGRPVRTPLNGYPHDAHAVAFLAAWWHMQRCR
jgi:hypothetical protein